MPQFQESEVGLLLKKCPDKKTSDMSNDTAFVKALTKVLNATLEIKPASLAMTLSKKGHAMSGVVATATGSQELKAVNFAWTQALKTIGLGKLAGMTPTKASIYLTLTVAEKVVSAAGMGQVNKCKLAIASLSATSGMGALTCFASGAFTMGIGCVAGAIAIAADAFDVYGQCFSKSSTSVDSAAMTSAGQALP